MFRNNKDLLLKLGDSLDILISGKNLTARNKSHQLKGEFKNCFEFRVKPGILLIYKKDKKEGIICLLRIGSHSDIF